MARRSSEQGSGVFDALAQYLRDNAQALMKQWRNRATSDPSQPARRHNLTGSELDDHLSALILMLALTLSDGDTSAPERDGAQHGHQRRAHGYTVTEVVEELGLFREVILGAVETFNLMPETVLAPEQLATARLRLLRVLDRSVNSSVEQCFRETQEARDAAERRLEETNAALREADAQKDRFLTMLSHELRNPLSPILSAAQVLQRLRPQDPALDKPRAIIERQARHLAKLVDDLLDVNRISHGKLELKPRVVHFQDAVSLAIESCRPTVEANELDLRIERTNEPLRVFADPTRLAQVATNLLTNSCKFTPPAGSIHVLITREDNEAVLRVKDTGIGISPGMLPRVFEPFSQADSSLHRKAGGLGVGLMVAKNLIEMQGGRIEAYSEGEGKGAEFVIRLPLALGSPAASAFERTAAGTDQVPPAGARRIVLVDDNDDAREALGTGLRLLGHEVVLAATADETLRLAETMCPDVFIVDIGLPDMNGFDLARSLRRLPAGRAATLLALSGYGSPIDKVRAHDAGFSFHLTKPADLEQIHALISREPGPPVDK